MWSPDEPVFVNVTERRRVPMALLDDVRRPDETVLLCTHEMSVRSQRVLARVLACVFARCHMHM